MKVLFFYNLSVTSLPLMFFFRLLNYKVIFVCIEEYLQKKNLIKFLSFLNINWFNYQEYDTNYVNVERVIKAPIISDILSNDVSTKFWCTSTKEIYEDKNYLNACLNDRIWNEAHKLIELFTIAKKFKDKGNSIFLWTSNSFISKKLNIQFYNFKNLNFLPNFYVIKSISILIDVLKNRFLFFFLRKKTNNFIKVNKLDFKNNFDKFKVAYFPHKGIFYYNTLKDLFYSENKDDPFFCQNILHVEWDKNITKESLDYYEKNKISYASWKDFGSELKIFFKLFIYSIKNIKFLFKLGKYDIQILYFYLFSSFKVLNAEDNLSRLKNLKIVLVGYDSLFPREISVACKKRNIKSIACQERIVQSSYVSLMIFDYYFAAGEKSKNILQKRMSKPYVDNFIEMHLFKISKYQHLSGLQNGKYNLNNNLRCLIIEGTSLKNWYQNGRYADNCWRDNITFYKEIILLSKKYPKMNFLIKSKNFDWMNISYYSEILKEINQTKNIEILKDKKWTSEEIFKACDFCLARYSSIADEILSLGKPIIIYDKFGYPDYFFDYDTRILARNYDEVTKKINLLIKDYDKYNISLDEDRKKLYYNFEPQKINKEINKIFKSS